MFPYDFDPQFHLDLQNQRAAERRRNAGEHRLSRSAAHLKHRLFGRRPRPVRAPDVP